MSHSLAPPGVRLDLVDAVARIRFDRPPVNAFTVEEFRLFHAYLKQVGDDPRPVLLTGANGMFSAGFDIRQPGLDEAATVDAARDCLTAIQDHPAPVVAAVEGAAVGIGLLIAVSADILVISRSARLRMPEVMLGIDSDVAPLRRFLPDPWIRRMCLSGEAFTATDIRLDYCAGATVCEPGTTEQAAAAVFESFTRIDPSFLERTKRRLADLLSTLALTQVEVSHKVASCSILTALICRRAEAKAGFYGERGIPRGRHSDADRPLRRRAVRGAP